MNRQNLESELREIEGSYEHEITPAKRRRAKQIIKILQECRCRHCAKIYNFVTARGDYRGFCSAKCQHAKAKELGCKRYGPSEYQILKQAGCIGDDYVVK